jgi:hypothetical protein
MTDAIAPQHGCRYTFEEIQRHFKADLVTPWEIVRKDDRILALRLKSPVNSEIKSAFRCHIYSNKWNEAEVWVGKDATTVEWGQKQYQCKHPLHLYFAPNLDNTYNYEGLFTVALRQSTPEELAEAEYLWQLKSPISRIIYLEGAP